LNSTADLANVFAVMSVRWQSGRRSITPTWRCSCPSVKMCVVLTCLHRYRFHCQFDSV